jgi:glutaredoxin
LTAWVESLGGIDYPLLSDFWPHGVVAEKYGVLRSEGFTERAIFVIDKNGIVRYIDIHDIDKQPSNDELLKILREIDPQAASTEPREGIPATAPAIPAGEIVMYCTSWCPDCRRARIWLKANHIDYVDVDIDTNPAASDQVKKWNGGKRISPTFDIGGVIIANFDEVKLANALKDRLRK